jgi:hypothetical protein
MAISLVKQKTQMQWWHRKTWLQKIQNLQATEEVYNGKSTIRSNSNNQ